MSASKPQLRLFHRPARKMTPRLESLEGRALLAVIAATHDVNNNQVIFGIGQNGVVGPGGVVYADRQVATNISASPYRPNGLETLAGITATSVAAYQAADGSPVVLATTGPESYIYSDAYEPTGNALQPYAWTGWKQISTFVAQSVVAVGATDGVGPAIFAVGANSNVYEDLFVDTASVGQFTDFQRLAGLSATSLAATYDSHDTFRIFALTAAESYVYQATSTNSGDTISTAGWSPVSDGFVARSISVASGPADATAGADSPDTLMVFATGGEDYRVFDDSLVLDPRTGTRTGAGFQAISITPDGDDQTPTASFIASSATSQGDYLTLFGLNAGGIYDNEYVVTSSASAWSGWQPVDYLPSPDADPGLLGGVGVASVLTAGGGVEVAAGGDLNFSAAPAHAALDGSSGMPVANAFSYATSILSSGYRPVVTSVGLTGYPVVFSTGSDGSVYESQDLATGSQPSTGRDAYSAYAQLAGLHATSLAATTEPDGIALFALTAGSSYVFEDQYRPTGDGASHAWTGWQQLGNFVATSIGAATGGDSAANGPTVFAIGADGNVYDAGSAAPASPSDGYATGSFAVLSGLASPMISVRATSTGIEVAALAGVESDAYSDLDTAGTWSGWQMTGNYVMTSVLAATSADGGPSVAGTSPFGYQAVADEDGLTGWGSYRPVYFYTIPDGSYKQLNGFASVTLPDRSGVSYLELIQPLQLTQFDDIYPAFSPADGTSIGGLPATGYAGYGTSIATVPDGLTPTFYVVGAEYGEATAAVITVFQAISDSEGDRSYVSRSLGQLP